MTHLRSLFVSLALGVSAQAAETATIVFYVSPRGNDQWSGRLPAADARQQDGPFAKLSAARDAIRRLRRENRLAGPVDVLLLEGTYHLAEPFVLTAEDTGTEKQPITYRAYPGHHPVLSGGRVIDDWRPFQGKIVESRLRGTDGLGEPSYDDHGLGGRPYFRQLFFRGQRQMRARWPNQDPAEPLYSGWAFPGIETDDGFEFDFTHDRVLLDTKTGSRCQGGGFSPTVQLDDGTLVTACSFRGEDNQTHLEAIRWRLPAAR